jgi:hypothetical protein
MFEEIPFVLGFLAVSLIMSRIMYSVEYKPLKIAVQVVAIIGVIVHEISHVLMCIVTNTKINNVTLLKKVENERPSNKIYGGQVTIQPDTRISFLQALVVGLAPLFVSFWIFFFLLSELSNPNIIDIVAIFYVFLMVSLFLGAAPSTGDLSQIASAFTYDTAYSIYQLLLLVISIFSVWIIITAQQIPIIHEIVNYIFILLIYYSFKYSFIGVNRLCQWNFKNRSISNSNPIKRRRVMRQFNTKRTREKEAQW